MKFEKRFPSLKGKGKKIDGFETNKVFYDFDIEDSCFDKKRVEDVINGLRPASLGNEKLFENIRKELKKELGLIK